METIAVKGTVIPAGAESQNGLLDKAVLFQAKVEQLEIGNDADFQNAAELTRQIMSLQSEVTAYWEPMRASAWESYQAVQSSKKAMMAPLTAAEAALRAKMASYTMEQERRRKAQEAALRAEAEAEAKRKLEEARRARADGDEAGALYAEAEAEVMRGMAVAGGVKATGLKAEGVTTRKKWVVESIDPQTVPVFFQGREIRPVDKKAVTRLIADSKGTIQIPGVTYREDVAFTVRK